MILCACLPAVAQDPQSIEVKGLVRSENEPFLYGYMVELSGLTSRPEALRADVHSDGSFAVRGVTPGDYLLRVTTSGGGVVKEEFVSVREHATTLEVRLPHADRPGPAGTISVNQLQHPPSARAVQAAATAQRFVASGKQEKALEELRKAIRISPDYAAAHSNLGALYIRMRDYADARPEIERSLAIAGPNAIDLANLAFLEATDQRIPEAVDTARAALRADPANAHAHYLLGTLLLLDRRTVPEGVRHLERAAAQIPSARAALDRVCRGAAQVCSEPRQ
jgi:tetratricopeptide (TPR) repeat protein